MGGEGNCGFESVDFDVDKISARHLVDVRSAVKAVLFTALVFAVGESNARARDYDPLMGRIGEARFALFGEASHGTHEFYCERAEITKRLIVEKNFSAVAVEADWPDAYRLNRYVRGADAFSDS